MDAAEIDATLLNGLEHRRRVIITRDADQSGARPPQGAAKRAPYNSAPPGCPMRVVPPESTTSSTSKLPNSTIDGSTVGIQSGKRTGERQDRLAIHRVAPEAAHLHR